MLRTSRRTFIASLLAAASLSASAAEVEAGWLPFFRPVSSGSALAISGAPPDAVVGMAYSFTPAVSGGSGNRAFTQTGTLPAGLSFNSSTGQVSGTPTSGTVFPVSDFGITVSDDTGSASLTKVGAPVYPMGVHVAHFGLNGRPAWDAKSVYRLSDPANCGCQIPLASLKVPGIDAMPGWGVAVTGTRFTGRLSPNADGAVIDGFDLTGCYVLPSTFYKNCKILNFYVGPNQVGPSDGAAVIKGGVGWTIKNGTLNMAGSTKYTIPLLIQDNTELAFCRVLNPSDDPLHIGDVFTDPYSNGRGTCNVHDNYFAEPLFDRSNSANHVDAFTLVSGQANIFRNLLSGRTLTFNNQGIKIGPIGTSVYGAEIYNNVTEGFEPTNSYSIQCDFGDRKGFLDNVKIRDNCVSKDALGYYYPTQQTGLIQSIGNVDTATGAAITEAVTDAYPTLTTPGTPSAAVVGTAITVSGEVWDTAAAIADQYQWLEVITDTGTNSQTNINNTGLLLYISLTKSTDRSTAGGTNGSGTASYTPSSGDVGKTIVRMTKRCVGGTGGNAGKYGKCGFSNPVTVTAS